MTLDLPGAVLDTSHVSDVLGLKARDADAEVIRILPGRPRTAFGFKCRTPMWWPMVSMTSPWWIC